MNHRIVRVAINCICMTAASMLAARGAEAPSEPLDVTPTLKEYEALAKLPDLSEY